MFKNHYQKITILFVFCLFSLHWSGCTDCNVTDIQEISGLIDDQTIVAYVTNCGATIDYFVNVSFKTPNINIRREKGDIFSAYHGNKIRIEKISPDTVKIVYAARDVWKQKMQEKGITFIYERNWKVFSDSLRSAGK